MKPSDAVTTLLSLGWTEAQVAAATGVSQPTINRIKKGARPSFDTGTALLELASSSRPPPSAGEMPTELATTTPEAAHAA